MSNNEQEQFQHADLSKQQERILTYLKKLHDLPYFEGVQVQQEALYYASHLVAENETYMPQAIALEQALDLLTWANTAYDEERYKTQQLQEDNTGSQQ